MKQNTIVTLADMKARGEKISQLTCYDYSTARLMDQAGINMILVGDSLGMTMQGYSDTIPVTMEEMIVYGRSVVRGCENTFVVVDMPFMSYQASVEQAVVNAGRLMKETGCDAVKLEGGREVCDQIRAITAAGIPVCAHVGMTPQSHHAFGGFKVQGKGEEGAARVLADAMAVQAAGAFAVVPVRGGKVAGIRALLESYGIAPEETMAFGDFMNDLEMLQEAGYSVAMRNALPQIKAVCREETAYTNDEDGVIRWIRQWLKKGIE